MIRLAAHLVVATGLLAALAYLCRHPWVVVWLAGYVAMTVALAAAVRAAVGERA